MSEKANVGRDSGREKGRGTKGAIGKSKILQPFGVEAARFALLSVNRAVIAHSPRDAHLQPLAQLLFRDRGFPIHLLVIASFLQEQFYI